MTNKKSDRPRRNASSTRLIILVLFLVVVGAGCIYEFAFARPQFQSAWEKIKTVDASSKSGEKTSEDIEELMGRAPAAIDESQHEECIVHTYRWPSGLLVKSHYIHVVFTKLKPGLVETRPELEGKLFYLSAAADMPLDPDDNFPLEKETILMSMNPPGLSMGGGGGSQRPPTSTDSDDSKGEGDEEGDGNDDQAATSDEGDSEEPATDDQSGDEESGDSGSGESAEDETPAGESDDDKQADDKGGG